MTSTMERAVEVGARAIFSETYAHDLAKEPAETIELYHGLARNCLRAAFPIMAEELVEQVEAARRVSCGSEFIVTALRARIQHMATEGEKLE